MIARNKGVLKIGLTIMAVMILMSLTVECQSEELPSCNENLMTPMDFPHIWPGAQMPTYVCALDLPHTTVKEDLIVIFAYDQDNDELAVIKAMLWHEYADLWAYQDEDHGQILREMEKKAREAH